MNKTSTNLKGARNATSTHEQREHRRGEHNKELKNYEILFKLGEGSFGQVHKVRDKISGEILVMKIIEINSSNPGDLNDKLQECTVIKNLKHPYICRFKQFFEDQKKLCILFEYCDKGDLQEYLNNQ